MLSLGFPLEICENSSGQKVYDMLHGHLVCDHIDFANRELSLQFRNLPQDRVALPFHRVPLAL